MHCIRRGKGDAVLFIHGMPTNCTLWEPVIEQLAPQHRCFAIDLPGMGKTPFVPYSPTYLDRVAEQLDALRIQHGVKKWHVVGHDAGAAVAVHYASHFSKNVGCLALLSPAIFPDLKPFFLLNHLRKPIVGEMLAPLLHILFWHIAMKRALDGTADRRKFKSFYKLFSGPTGPWQLMRLVRWGKPEEMLAGIPSELCGLPMPTLLFQGSRDVLPQEFAERASTLIPKARLVRLDSGHFIPLDRPTNIATSLRKFFKQNKQLVAEFV